MGKEKTRAKLMAWTLFPTGLLLFILAMLLVNVRGDELSWLYLMDAIALLGIIFVAVATAATYVYFKRS